MAHLPTEFCKQVAAARRAQGITQSALAKSAGCKQSAVSMFESGHPEKLSMEAVEKIAKILNIPLEAQKHKELPAASCSKKGYCPNSACLSNIPYIINCDLFIWPKLIGLTDELKYCSICGEVLERSCPQCGGQVTEGACCGICGHPRVMTALPPGTDPTEWVTERRNEIQQWRRLTDK
ncbi:MAG: helix-turn-helix transcriptional regulator [Kiritimatiellae bacterium]|jgi:transcriptional regulator with XRE-family HTH domain|nr:helix-turn-helix transcriptional regulator [Kiritimatiellia bacterium]